MPHRATVEGVSHMTSKSSTSAASALPAWDLWQHADWYIQQEEERKPKPGL